MRPLLGSILVALLTSTRVLLLLALVLLRVQRISAINAGIASEEPLLLAVH